VGRDPRVDSDRDNRARHGGLTGAGTAAGTAAGVGSTLPRARLSRSESTRGSALLAMLELWGPAVVLPVVPWAGTAAGTAAGVGSTLPTTAPGTHGSTLSSGTGATLRGERGCRGQSRRGDRLCWRCWSCGGQQWCCQWCRVDSDRDNRARHEAGIAGAGTGTGLGSTHSTTATVGAMGASSGAVGRSETGAGASST
jgi:hypothetical protein